VFEGWDGVFVEPELNWLKDFSPAKIPSSGFLFSAEGFFDGGVHDSDGGAPDVRTGAVAS